MAKNKLSRAKIDKVASPVVARPRSREQLYMEGKALRDSCARLSHAKWTGKSIYANHGQRVVNGLRLSQSASDLFLGWTEARQGRHFYIRQLHDMKIKVLVELFTVNVMGQHAEFCAWALARAHARAGQPALIAGYLGKGDQFDEAVADFAAAYAEQNKRDYQTMLRAVRQGRIKVYTES